MSRKQPNPNPPDGAVKPKPPPEPPKPWLLPNDDGESPGDICCMRATGKYCYEHDPANYRKPAAPNHFGGAMNAGLTPRQKPQPVKYDDLLQQIKGIAILENDRKQNVALDAIITLIRKWQRE